MDVKVNTFFGLKSFLEIGFKPKTKGNWTGHQMDVKVNTFFGLKSLLEIGFRPKTEGNWTGQWPPNGCHSEHAFSTQKSLRNRF